MPKVWCAFAVTNARATRLNATALTCTSPPSFAGTVVLELSHVRTRDWRFIYEEAAVVSPPEPTVNLCILHPEPNTRNQP